MKKLIFPVLMIAALLALSSCNFPSNGATATVAPMDAINTSAAQTVIAMSTALAATTPAPSNENPTQPSQDTAIPATDLPVATLVPLATASPISGDISPTVCDRLKFVKDINVPDGTVFSPGESFTKTWRIQNAGTCTWGNGYQLVFDSGDPMSGPVSTNLPSTVAPGQEIQLSVNLKAPASSGKYIGYWKLENASGQRFGYGDGNKAFWVGIEVGVTPVPFAVTNVQLSVDHDNVVASCGTPYKFTFSVKITTNASGTVSFWLENSAGDKSKKTEVDFSKAGSQTVTSTWNYSSDFNGWVKVYIDAPNHQFFAPLNIQLKCQ